MCITGTGNFEEITGCVDLECAGGCDLKTQKPPKIYMKTCKHYSMMKCTMASGSLQYSIQCKYMFEEKYGYVP